MTAHTPEDAYRDAMAALAKGEMRRARQRDGNTGWNAGLRRGPSGAMARAVVDLLRNSCVEMTGREVADAMGMTPREASSYLSALARGPDAWMIHRVRRVPDVGGDECWHYRAAEEADAKA